MLRPIYLLLIVIFLPACSDYFAKSEAQVQKKILTVTPLGTPRDEVQKVAKHDLKVRSLNYVSDAYVGGEYVHSRLYSTLGISGFMQEATAEWDFDQNEQAALTNCQEEGGCPLNHKGRTRLRWRRRESLLINFELHTDAAIPITFDRKILKITSRIIMEPLFLIIPLGIVLFFVLVAIFQWFWNITMPQVFNLRMISYWEAFRILIISGFLFGGSSLPDFKFNM